MTVPHSHPSGSALRERMIIIETFERGSTAPPTAWSCLFNWSYVGCIDQLAGSSFLSEEAAAAVGCTFPGAWWAGA